MKFKELSIGDRFIFSTWLGPGSSPPHKKLSARRYIRDNGVIALVQRISSVNVFVERIRAGEPS